MKVTSLVSLMIRVTMKSGKKTDYFRTVNESSLYQMIDIILNQGAKVDILTESLSSLRNEIQDLKGKTMNLKRLLKICINFDK